MDEFARSAVGAEARAGTVVSVASAGDLLRWHPHLHLLASDGDFAPDGSFRSFPEWEAAVLRTGAVTTRARARPGPSSQGSANERLTMPGCRKVLMLKAVSKPSQPYELVPESFGQHLRSQ